MKEPIKARLCAMAEPAFRDFSAALIPGCENMLGVRVPKLRKLCRELLRGDWLALLDAPDEIFEEAMLRGLLIAEAKLTDDMRMELLRAFIPAIDNWSVCDSVCGSLHCMAQAPDVWWPFLLEYVASGQEFQIRFAVVCMLFHFLGTDYLAQVLTILPAISHSGFYVRMAVGWALATAYPYDGNAVTEILRENRLDAQTHRICIQKLIDSHRVPDADKALLRTLRRK